MGISLELCDTVHRVVAHMHRCQKLGFGAILVTSSLCMTSSVFAAQEILWDHIGNTTGGERRPLDFDTTGDLDGDGVGDFIYGSALLRYAAIRSGADGSLIMRHFGGNVNSTSTLFGNSVANLGLIDGDNVPDYAISSPNYSPAGQAQGAGLVQVFSGATHEEIIRIHENLSGQHIGGQVVGLGDVNADGFPDFGITSTQLVPGPLRIYLGPDGSFYREHPWSLGFVGFAHSIARYGDYDGDGYDDYLRGIVAAPTSVPFGGRIELHSGKDGSVLLTMEGDLPEGRAGFAVCAAGDWDGDGIGEIAAGAPAETNLGFTNDLAGVFIFSGADGSILRFFDGEAYCNQNSAFGYSVFSGKDVNGDGVPDLIVGAPLEPWLNTGPGLLGSAFVFSGATGNLLWEHKGTTPAEHLGYQVKFIDDHNGDGIDDWMALAPDHDIDGFGVGGWPAGRLTALAGAVGDATPVCKGGANSVGDGARLWNSGPISVRENGLELALSDMPQGSLAILIHGQLAHSNPFGAGELCLGLPISVLDIAVTNSDGTPGEAGEVRVEVDLKAMPFTAAGNVVQAGDTWAFQALYRDQGMRNTSNALDILFLP
ncbi:MAG: hypothetical protein ACI8X5_003994 [Planctomycetota bacterium]|jgi:hypothetical protein